MQAHPLPLLPADDVPVQSSTAPIRRQTECSSSATAVESLSPGPGASHTNRDHGKDGYLHLLCVCKLVYAASGHSPCI